MRNLKAMPKNSTLKGTQAYSIQVDYRDDKGSSIVKLSWSSPSVAMSVVPASQLLAK